MPAIYSLKLLEEYTIYGLIPLRICVRPGHRRYRII